MIFVFGLLFYLMSLPLSYRNHLTLTHARRARWGSWHGLVMVSGFRSVWIPRSAYTTRSHTSIYKTWISSLTSARCWVTLCFCGVNSSHWLEMSLVVTLDVCWISIWGLAWRNKIKFYFIISNHNINALHSAVLSVIDRYRKVGLFFCQDNCPVDWRKPFVGGDWKWCHHLNPFDWK